MADTPHQAGFVNIIGKPNVGKSTLMNALVGDKLSIITAKAQTTRHRILGILNGANFQVVYSDTPGLLTPQYALQQSMMRAVRSVLVDADVLLWVVDVRDQAFPEDFCKKLQQHTAPVLMLVNKVDLVSKETLDQTLRYWAESVDVAEIIPVAALQSHNVPYVLERILAHLPMHPPYYPKDMLSDKPERFFVAEIVREKILQHYHQEIPYSVEIVVDSFKEEASLIRLSVIIHVEKHSQKGIIIGKRGESLKKVGIAARQDLERFFRKKIFLEQYVKVVPGWRKQVQQLQRFGYAV